MVLLVNRYPSPSAINAILPFGPLGQCSFTFLLTLTELDTFEYFDALFIQSPKALTSKTLSIPILVITVFP